MEQPNGTRRTWAQRVVAGEPKRRLLPALLSASVAAWATLWLILLILYGIDRVGRGGPVLDVAELTASFFLIFFLPVVAASTIVLGSILHETLQFLRIQRWYPYALAGCSAGFVVGSALLALSSGFSPEYARQQNYLLYRAYFVEALPLAMIFGGLPGLTAAVAFWAMLRPHRL